MKRLGWPQMVENLWAKYEGPGEATTVSVSWKIRVVSRTGCPNGVYLEANVRDESKTVVGFANDLLPSLPAKQPAVLELTTPATAADGTLNLSPTQATCR
jgi:hypothetical protein